MSGPRADGTVGSLLSFYKHERNIYGRCPHCREPFRLSEVKLTYGKEPPRDLLTRLKKDKEKLLEQIESLEADIEDVESGYRQELEDQQYRFDTEIDKRIGKREKAIRENAIAKSRAGQLGKTLEKVAPMFPGFGHHPYDVRPVFDPIDFVVFDGYFKGEVTDVVFVEFKTGQSRFNDVQSSIREAIRKKRVHFEERRLSKAAMKALTSANKSRAALPDSFIE